MAPIRSTNWLFDVFILDSILVEKQPGPTYIFILYISLVKKVIPGLLGWQIQRRSWTDRNLGHSYSDIYRDHSRRERWSSFRFSQVSISDSFRSRITWCRSNTYRVFYIKLGRLNFSQQENEQIDKDRKVTCCAWALNTNQVSEPLILIATTSVIYVISARSRKRRGFIRGHGGVCPRSSIACSIVFKPFCVGNNSYSSAPNPASYILHDIQGPNYPRLRFDPTCQRKAK